MQVRETLPSPASGKINFYILLAVTVLYCSCQNEKNTQQTGDTVLKDSQAVTTIPDSTDDSLSYFLDHNSKEKSLPFEIIIGSADWGSIDDIYQNEIPRELVVKHLFNNDSKKVKTKEGGFKQYYSRYKISGFSDNLSAYVLYITDGGDEHEYIGYFLVLRDKSGSYTSPIAFSASKGELSILSQVESKIISPDKITRHKIETAELGSDSKQYTSYQETLAIDPVTGIPKQIKIDSLGSKTAVDTFSKRISL
ncbi:hypothetical protein [Filimonas effusa]|uniref:Uncharacterized protein n=1 Tax=Filimonas effusa TaxID=2508721 RepID=A0A4Q1DAH2_9BACT|nr:hypothetical protein [Filimonas effusa]RXK85898.1 hypothetical protein ESB13_03555 [Filimonas effusa]